MAELPPISINTIGQTADEVIASAKELEDLGYPIAWVGENRWEGYALAAAIGAITKRITIGTAVAVWSRPPVTAILGCATVDQISGGRFVHGLGSGPANRNENWYNMPYQRAALRLREYLTCLRLAWSSSAANPVNFEGQIYQIRGYHRSHRPVRDPLPTYVGVARPLATQIAGELSDGIIIDTGLPVRYVQEVLLPALEKGANKAGRPLRDYFVNASILIAVDRDRKQAIEWARHRIVSHVVHDYYRQLYAFGGFEKEAEAAFQAVQRGDEPAAHAAITEEMVLAHACAGTIDDVRKQIHQWAGVVNDLRLSAPLGTLSGAEIRENWLQIVEAFPAKR